MALDPYSLCPCGSGKKLKFCCADVATDIEKIHRMIEGDQPRAALRHVEQTLAGHPNRASLLDLKVSLELSLEDLDAARQTVDKFIAAHPDSPNSLACKALLLAETDQVRPAAEALQRALAHVELEMPERVYEAIGTVGAALLAAGHIAAAQAHLWLHAGIAPQDDRRALQAIVGLNHYSGLPLLLRDRLIFRTWSENAPWIDDARQASRLADQGKWQQAVAIIDHLGQSYGADPSLVFNRALLGGWLVDDRALVAGLHAFAQLDVPLEEAVEAEAVAQLLDPDQKEPPLHTVLQTYAVNDEDALVNRLREDKRAQRIAVNPDALTESDEPKPRYMYVLFDRAMPESGADIAREAIPRAVAMLNVFGRQTDRAERLELTVDRDEAFAATIGALKEIGGDALGEMCDETIVGSVSPTEHILNWRWQLPRDTPRDVRQQLLDEERRIAILERWTALPRPALGGKTPRQAAGDPELRIPLLAAVLLIEQGSNSDRDFETIAELRRELGLPQPEPIEPVGEAVYGLRLVRVPRLKMDEVPDDALAHLYRRALLANAEAAIVCIAREAVRRPSIADHISPSEAYRRLITAERDLDRALSLVNQARENSRSAGESVAGWDLTELNLHITAGDAERARTMMEQIERDHGDDPQVAATLYQMLYNLGIIRPGEMPQQAAIDDDMPMAAVGSEAEPEPSRIWTPGSNRPSGGKTTLWTPS
jgi:tetratricopeptide (TPR) repeat protein